MIDHKNIFIDGKWVPSSGKNQIAVINPATEETIAMVPRGTAEDVDLAVQAAARAFPSWSQTSVQERSAIFTKIARLTEARADEIARIITSEIGYPLSTSLKAHVIGAVFELDLIAKLLGEVKWSEKLGTANVRRVPSGVVGAITAWNAPLRGIIYKAGAAIAAGCTAVVKPSEVAPLAAYIFADICTEAGLPAGVFNMVIGTGPEVGEAISAHPLVDMVSLTGSVRAGRRVMEVASGTVKRVHLELGGKSPNLICADADLERAVNDGIEDAMRNTGQVCGGLTRMLVPRARLKEVEELAVRKAQTYVVGDPFDPATTLGPVSTASAVERIHGYIRSGQEEGARLLTGGCDLPKGVTRGYFIQPTIFTGNNQLRIAREEIFGPVVVIIPYDDEAEAIRIANDTVYGLAAAVWCADPARARSIASQIRAGRVRINGAPLDTLGTHGGFKLSGVGREWGRIGIEEFTEYQSVIG